MNKVLSNSKFSTPSKFVRRVLSRTSNASRPSQEEINHKNRQELESVKSKPERGILESELMNLQEELSILQVEVHKMQDDAEKKEKAFANLAREKQQLSTDLRREKRSSTSLKQQLEDERKFYYKEKEVYCQEMNDCKKLKKKLSEEINGKRKEDNREPENLAEYKSQIGRLKEALNQTLEANYNLSVKFLRMKNTKLSLKNRLKKHEREHEQSMQNLQAKINNIKNDIADVVNKQFMLPISPSNKKYLQIIKQNGKLLHENLCLQIDVDRLVNELEALKKTRLHNDLPKIIQERNYTPRKIEKETKHVSIQVDKTSKSKPKKKSIKQLKTEEPKIDIKQSKSEEKPPSVIKIYERTQVPGIPKIVMLPLCVQDLEEASKTNLEEPSMAALVVAQKSSETNVIPASQSSSQNETQISELTNTSSHVAVRTQSTPEIFQTSFFVSKHKP